MNTLDYGLAIKCCEEVLGVDPDNTDALFILGKAYARCVG